MGKGRDKKKKKSKGSGGVKKAHDQSRRELRNEAKRERRERRKAEGGEDDIGALLAGIAMRQREIKETKVYDNVDPPSPRCSCTWTSLGGIGLTGAKLKHSILLYGGEHYDGQKTHVYGDLYRYDVKARSWSLIQCKRPPKPRSAHQAFAHRGFFYVFGGEYTSPNQKDFKHYKDLWRLDVSTWEWEQLPIKGGPTARSGHRMVVVKGVAILFGGFFDTGKDLKYHNDLWTLDLDALKWTSHGAPGQLAPCARSACHLVADDARNVVYAFGGYSKKVVEDEGEHGITHEDMWCLDLTTMRWERIKKAGISPCQRAGACMFVHKRNALFFGGVQDHEADYGEIIVSEFFNDLFNFHLDKRRWFPVTLRIKGAAAGEAAPQSTLVVRKGGVGDSKHAAAAKIQSHFRGYAVRKAFKLYKVGGRVNELLYSPAIVRQDPGSKRIVHPNPRIKANVAIVEHVLWLYGGSFEAQDKEVTLDDVWCLNLNKLDGWTCVDPGKAKIEAWQGSDEEDDMIDEFVSLNAAMNGEDGPEEGEGEGEPSASEDDLDDLDSDSESMSLTE